MFTLKDILYSLYYALQAWHLNRQTDLLYEGKLKVTDIFIIVGYHDDIVYVTPKVKLPYWYDLTMVVNPSTWKAIKNQLNTRGAAITFADYLSEAISQAGYDQRKH